MNDDSLGDKLLAEQQRSAQLEAELVILRSRLMQLQEAYTSKEWEANRQRATIDTLITEIRGLAALAQKIQEADVERLWNPTGRADEGIRQSDDDDDTTPITVH